MMRGILDTLNPFASPKPTNGKRQYASGPQHKEIVRGPARYTAFGKESPDGPSAYGYRSAVVQMREGRGLTVGSGEINTFIHRLMLVNQSREFMRDNPIYTNLIRVATRYTIGNGFTLEPQTRDDSTNQQLRALWDEDWAWPDNTGTLTGEDVEDMLCRELMTCGDTAALLLPGAKVQIIESEQIWKPGLREGCEKDKNGRPTKWWLCPWGYGGNVDWGAGVAYDANDVFFISEAERISGIRGVPPAQSAFAMLHRINDVCDSEAMAWQILARLAISINQREPGPRGWGESVAPDGTGAAGGSGINEFRITELDYALIFHGTKDEQVGGIERNIPGANFTASIMTFMRLLGLPLGLPLELVMLNWTDSNYSQSRAVLEQCYVSFMKRQNRLMKHFHDPLYARKIGLWLAQGRLRTALSPEELIKHRWIVPTFPWIDQLKEAQAQEEKLALGLTTHAQVCMSLGVDSRDVILGRESEIRAAIAIAQKIKADTQQDVPWELFAGLKVPGTPAKPSEKAMPEAQPQPKGKPE